jgi:hypothetical protein
MKKDTKDLPSEYHTMNWISWKELLQIGILLSQESTRWLIFGLAAGNHVESSQ